MKKSQIDLDRRNKYLRIFGEYEIYGRYNMFCCCVYLYSSISNEGNETAITDCVRFLLPPWIPPAHGFFLAPLPEVG